ncbi:MAG TPA: hypothetical protein VF553_20890 [Pyrinomonadaceae bacterium]
MKGKRENKLPAEGTKPTNIQLVTSLGDPVRQTGNDRVQLKLGDPEQVAQWVETQLERLQGYDEARVIELALYADCHHWHAFLLRAACVSDLLRRTTRLLGGSGKRDSSGTGVQAQLEKLCAQFGKKRSTLRTDARIYDKFFSTAEERALAREHCLPREYYVIALASPDPQEAIHFAMKKAADPQFNREVFREHVRPQIKQSTVPAEELQEPELSPLQISIPTAAQSVLKELGEITGKSEEELIVEAILVLRQSLLPQEKGEAASVDDQPSLFSTDSQNAQGVTQQEQAAVSNQPKSKASNKPKSSSQKAPAKKASKINDSGVELIYLQSPQLPLNMS